jgi:hypothetical protein
MFYCAIDETSFKRFRTAVDAIDKRIRFWKTELPKLMFFEYYRRVLTNIEVQRYESNYLPLNEKYQIWKMNHGYPDTFWEKFGNVRAAIRNIKPIPLKSGDTEGFIFALNLPYVTHVENGYDGPGKGGAPMHIPARPLFGPTLEELKRDFYTYAKQVFEDLNMTWSK